jgi:hypothetical protein
MCRYAIGLKMRSVLAFISTKEMLLVCLIALFAVANAPSSLAAYKNYVSCGKGGCRQGSNTSSNRPIAGKTCLPRTNRAWRYTGKRGPNKAGVVHSSFYFCY